jgi:putative pyruvate formate lyase activating enzyme
MKHKPSYIGLYENGVLEGRLEAIEELIIRCRLCPHECGVDRRVSKSGNCKSGLLPIVSSSSPHFGEEAPLVGKRGSGTIFFTNCTLSCIFCQNYDISHLGCGREISCNDLALMMLSLQQRGCHNINFVTPTHMVYAIVKALILAVPLGLHLPLVYNSGGYDSVETLQLLNGIFDIYMPDFKYADASHGYELSGVKDYPNVARRAIREMHNQVGDLKIAEGGVAHTGLLVRHLVLPQNLAGTQKVIDFLCTISKFTYLNIMDQYHPVYRAAECPALKRRITVQEFDEAVIYAQRAGMSRLDGRRLI